MTSDELDRKMEFIIERRAQFSGGIKVMREVHAADRRLLKEEISVAKEQIRSLNEAVMTVVGIVGRLTESQERTDARIAELAIAQARTDERLNVLIDVVGHDPDGNGGSGSSDRA